MDIEAARVLVYNAARMKELGDLDFVKEAAMAKLFSSRTAERTAWVFLCESESKFSFS